MTDVDRERVEERGRVLKDRDLSPAGADPWLTGFIDGALEAIGHHN